MYVGLYIIRMFYMRLLHKSRTGAIGRLPMRRGPEYQVKVG